MSEVVADALAESREYLEKNGWWKNRLRGPNGRQACALGAILFSQGLTKEDEGCALAKLVCASLVRVLPKKSLERWDATNNVTWWNDHVAESKQAVLDAFAKAEKIERAGFDPDAA